MVQSYGITSWGQAYDSPKFWGFEEPRATEENLDQENGVELLSSRLPGYPIQVIYITPAKLINHQVYKRLRSEPIRPFTPAYTNTVLGM